MNDYKKDDIFTDPITVTPGILRQVLFKMVEIFSLSRIKTISMASTDNATL